MKKNSVLHFHRNLCFSFLIDITFSMSFLVFVFPVDCKVFKGKAMSILTSNVTGNIKLYVDEKIHDECLMNELMN